MKRIKIEWVFVVMFIKLLLILCYIITMSSCNLSRKLDKSVTLKDTISVSTIDSNWLKKLIETNTATKASGSELRIYQPATRPAPDVNNYFTTPGTDNSQLLAVLSNWQHENKTNTKETVDSGDLARNDSTAAKLQATSKETETKAGTPWYVWLFASVLGLLVIERILQKFKIIKA